MRAKPPTWLWLTPVLTMGLLAVVGPFTIALKVGTRRAWLWCAGSGFATVLSFALVAAKAGFLPDLGALVSLANLVASTVYTMMTAQQLDWSGRAATLEMPPNPKPLSRNEAAMAQA